MAKRRIEPRRLPPPTATPEERAGAGCLALLVLPAFLSALFATFASAGAPFAGADQIWSGLMGLQIIAPIVVILGSVLATAVSRAVGTGQRIELVHAASAAIPIAALAIFVVAALTTAVPLLTGGAAVGVLGGIGVIVLAVLAAVEGRRIQKRQPERRRQTQQPAPPWEHPLARTEKVNLYAEAVVDQANIIAIVAAAGLSLVLLNPFPLLAAGGLELLYLATVPDTQWFRRRVEKKQMELALEQARERREEQKRYLATDQLQRHEQMVGHVARAAEAMRAAGFPLDPAKLDAAVDHHLWLMQLENYYADLDVATRLRELDKQLSAAEADVEGVEGRMREALDARLNVVRRRRKQMADFADRMTEVSDKRRTLEETLMLVTESALAGAMSLDDLDSVLLDLQTTEEVVLDLHDADDALEREIASAYAETEAHQQAS